MGNIDPSRLGGKVNSQENVQWGYVTEHIMKLTHFLYLVDRAQREPTATMYLAGAQPT